MKSINFQKMNIFILLLITFITITATFASADTDHYYKIEIQYSFEELSYSTISVEPSPKDITNTQGQYLTEILSADGDLLNISSFDIPTELFYETANEDGQINGGGTIILNESTQTVYLPYFEKAETINIYDLSLNKKLTIDIASFIQTDSIMAELSESEDTTTTTTSEDFLLDQIETPDTDDTKKSNKFTYLIIMGVVLTFVLITIIVKIKKK